MYNYLTLDSQTHRRNILDYHQLDFKFLVSCDEGGDHKKKELLGFCV